MHKLYLPRLGQTMEVGIVQQWLKEVGEPFVVGDPLYEVESEKTTIEVEAKLPGTLARLVVEPGEEVPVGTLLAVVADPGESLSDTEIEEAISEERARAPVAGTPEVAVAGAHPSATATSAAPAARIKAMPKARALAEELGIDLASLSGTGAGGAITVGDVERVAAERKGPAVRERRPVRGVRRTMVEVVTRSWREIPQFTQMVRVDARPLLDRRAAEAAAIKEEYNLDLSLSDLIIQAVVEAAREVPEANASFVGDAIVLYEDVNVSVAVATDAGLIVPVIRRAQDLSLGELAASLRDVAGRARSGKLSPDDVVGGTITVSNLGMFGIETGTPIVTPPQSAIVFAGSIVEQPAAHDGSVVVRPTMGISIAYDHRVLDGVTGARFTSAVRDHLESL